MNRSRFLALLGLLPFAAKGQTKYLGIGKSGDGALATPPPGSAVFSCQAIVDGKCFDSSGKEVTLGLGRKPKPKNGECPHCGTQHAVSKRDLDFEKRREKFSGPLTDRQRWALRTEIQRCSHCSAAFYVDSE